MGLCLSHSRTLKLVDKLGEGFDKKVLQWKSEAEASMDTIEDAVSSIQPCLEQTYYTLYM